MIKAFQQKTVWLFKVCRCCSRSVRPNAMDCRTNVLSDQCTVGPVDCRTNRMYGSLKFVAAAIHPAAIQYICRANGLADQWTVGPVDCRTNGLSDQ